jgi:hypothetical protein
MRYIIILILGVALGAGGAIYLLGVPRAAHRLPGTPIQAPNPGGDPAGTAVVQMDDKLFADVLGGIFRDLSSPSFQIARSGPLATDPSMRLAVFEGGCTNSVTLLAEAGNVKTRVQFADGKI